MNATKKQTITNHLIANGFAIKDASRFESVRAQFRFVIDEVVLIVFVGQAGRSAIDFEVRLADTTPVEIITANIDAAAQFACRNTSRHSAPLCR